MGDTQWVTSYGERAMEVFLLFFCLLAGATSVLSLLYAVIKADGLRTALCILMGAVWAMITLMTVVQIWVGG